MRWLAIGVCCVVSSSWLSVASAQQADEAGVQSTFFYAPTFAALARPQPGQKNGFILSSDVPPKGATVLEKYRYRIEMTAQPSPKSRASCNGVPAGGSAETFVIIARPMPGQTGKSFRINAERDLTEIK